MSKHQWHVARKGEEPSVVRHYKHLTRMYYFILRNPAMFKNRNLSVYDNCRKVTDISWGEIKQQVDNGIKELEARKWLKSKCKN
ncbi:hypothetical protein JTF06_12000 [Desemzia sp. RIT804]|uniref:hypothetical protein n=1 Tax=Desemzia sp. RIT 804 TaxID=2810209 RepID=UPI00194F05C9|nr:hypothetical protein [Desemzia sp. RIT 804]MBM6615608.1 hypothetical protein [Desemzia sp. RIT 804]